MKQWRYWIDTCKLYLTHPRGLRMRPIWSIRRIVETTIFAVSVTTPIRQIVNLTTDAIKRGRDAR